MVGQTLTVKGKPYRYYRCHHVYDKNTGHSCSARYVRGDDLEQAVWTEVKRVLGNPGVVLQELRRGVDNNVTVGEVAKLEGQLTVLEGRQRRLVHLYSLGSVSEEVIQKETEEIALEHTTLQQRLIKIKRPDPLDCLQIDPALLERVCAGVSEWLNQASETDRVLALEALQVNVEATKESAVINGVLPMEPPKFIDSEHTSRCSFNGESVHHVSRRCSQVCLPQSHQWTSQSYAQANIHADRKS
ncbi:MAG: zinc ribbon domain-containing protein, partial [Chloroflexi bacterium]|nr:zinc ribbon domain-containing protein [Chloroflexota bacterium]